MIYKMQMRIKNKQRKFDILSTYIIVKELIYNFTIL